MEVDEAYVEDGPRLTAEQRLASLKQYAYIAWDESKASAEHTASAQIRWEVFSTWMLLSCLALAEAEQERLQRQWAPKAWTSETIALRQLFMESHSLRALGAVLRWLRWSHRWALKADRSVEDGFVYSAGYDRTRRGFQLHGRLPAPFQEGALHPDGPLQHAEMFESADLEDERQLIADLWTRLRRGELRPALKLCAEGGQAWRTALLQGMLPFCEEPEGEYEFAITPGPDETVEEMLAFMKEEHSDWTDFGLLQSKGSQGNPWRRVWKEECFDAAARNLLPGSKMDLKELSIYGFCSGNYDALMPSCSADWADRCFGELHCLKEWLVERLLEDGQLRCGPGPSEAAWPNLGEGDLCAEEESAEDKALRTAKLCGRLAASLSPDVEAAVKEEVLQLLQRAQPRAEDLGWEAPGDVTQRFGQLQARLIAAAWDTRQGEEALKLLRAWLRDSPPFVLKQFAGYFAVWQKEVLQDLKHHVDVDDIVSMHVSELLLVASGPRWEEQCLRGQALEVIMEHCRVMQPEPRREALASLLLRLGRSAGSAAVAEAAATLSSRAEATPLAEVLKLAFSAFWARFPEEVFSTVAFLVHRALKIDDASAEEAFVGAAPAGVPEEADVEDLAFVVLCLLVFWLVARDASAQGDTIDGASVGLSQLTNLPLEDSGGLLGLLAGESRQRFLRSALDGVVVPLLTDTLLCLSAKDPLVALPLLPAMQASSLWTDAFHSAAPSTVNLSDLEWFLLLYVKHNLWKEAYREATAERNAARAPALSRFGAAVRPGPGVGHAAEAEKATLETAAAREALFDWARDRLGKERPLLEPLPATQTVLQDGHWQGLRKAMAWRVLLPLMDSFEAESDFQGAMEELFVAVADSPWMLKTLSPLHARALLMRVGHIPMSSEWP